MAQHSKKELLQAGMRGWITGRRGSDDLVRFVRAGEKGPEALYDVTFPEGGEAPVVSQPSEHTLSTEEQAQYSARLIALSSTAGKCSSSYNTVALKDPEGDGWLVWALAATTDADNIVIGGHVRFIINSEGKEIRARDDLSKGCMTFSRREMAKNGEFVGFLLTHLVSLTPVESHVFASLLYNANLFVGTRDGVAWKVRGGEIATIDMDTPEDDGFAARTLAGVSEHCKVMATKDEENPPHYYLTGDEHVILGTESSGAFQVKAPPGYTATGLTCARLDIVPAPNDHKVLTSGLVLYIGDTGVGHPRRIGVVELRSGQFGFHLVDGPAFTSDLVARIQKRIDGFQSATAKAAPMSIFEKAPVSRWLLIAQAVARTNYARSQSAAPSNAEHIFYATSTPTAGGKEYRINGGVARN